MERDQIAKMSCACGGQAEFVPEAPGSGTGIARCVFCGREWEVRGLEVTQPECRGCGGKMVFTPSPPHVLTGMATCDGCGFTVPVWGPEVVEVECLACDAFPLEIRDGVVTCTACNTAFDNPDEIKQLLVGIAQT